MWLSNRQNISVKLAFAGFFLLVLALSGCNIGKTLEVEKTVYIDNQIVYSAFPTATDKYLGNVTEEQVRTAFMVELGSHMSGNKLRPIDARSQADFVLVVTGISLSESSSTYTVDDADSPYNGTTFNLSNCQITTSARLYANSGGRETLLDDFSDSESKEEKVKNNRTLGDMITGDNKDNNEYRLKAFSDDVFIDVAQKGARSLGARVTNKVARYLK
jgi:hypothetical protein